MKKILLFITAAVTLAACVPNNDGVYTSVIRPSFSYSPTEYVTVGRTYVHFTNTSSVKGTTVARYYWHFGFDGAGSYSTKETPDSMLWTSPGKYPVKLTVFGADGNRATYCDTIKVIPVNAPPVADFTWSPSEVLKGTDVVFTSVSLDADGTVEQLAWEFPDGSKPEGNTAHYTFSETGFFMVSLTATDNRGESSTTTKQIHVVNEAITEITEVFSAQTAKVDGLTLDKNATHTPVPASVLAVSESGFCYFMFGKHVLRAYDMAGVKKWEYTSTNDHTYGKTEHSFPAVDTDGTVYWCGHGYDSSTGATIMYAFDGASGQIKWTNTGAYEPSARIAFSTPTITPSAVIIGSRGTGGSIKSFTKTGGDVIYSVANGGGANASVVAAKNGILCFPSSGTAGWRMMYPSDENGYSLVPSAGGFCLGSRMTAGRAQGCIDSDSRVYIAGTVSDGGWNYACFDLKGMETEDTALNPVWTATLPGGVVYSGTSLSADGKTAYIVADGAAPSVLYAINTEDGSRLWSFTLDAVCTGVPAVDNLGRIHLATRGKSYYVISPEGAQVYKHTLSNCVDGSVTLSSWGYCYFVGYSGTTTSDFIFVQAIEVPGTTGPAPSAWAQYGQNPGHCNYQK